MIIFEILKLIYILSLNKKKYVKKKKKKVYNFYEFVVF